MKYVIRHGSGLFYRYDESATDLMDLFLGISKFGATKFDSKEDAQEAFDILVKNGGLSASLLEIKEFDNV